MERKPIRAWIDETLARHAKEGGLPTRLSLNPTDLTELCATSGLGGEMRLAGQNRPTYRDVDLVEIEAGEESKIDFAYPRAEAALAARRF